MPIYALGDQVPFLHHTAFVHPDAVIVGEVRLGRHASVWPGAVIRADYGPVEIGDFVAVQDGTVIHGNIAQPTIIGERCVVGHLAHLEGCSVGKECLIGSGSIVMPRAQIGDGAVIGAGAVVRRGMVIPPGAAALGSPATVRTDVRRPATVPDAVRRHAELADRYRTQLRLIGPDRT